MYRVTNSNPGPRGFYANKDGGGRERVTVPAKSTVEVDLSEKQVAKLKSWEGLSFELIQGTAPAPEPAPAPAPAAKPDAPEGDKVVVVDPPKVEVRKVAGNKSAVFINDVQTGQPTSKAKADAEAAAEIAKTAKPDATAS